MLNQQLERSKINYQNSKFQTRGARYNEIATGRFQPQMQEADAGAILQREQQRNQVIEGVINNMRQQNPGLEEILNKFVDW